MLAAPGTHRSLGTSSSASSNIAANGPGVMTERIDVFRLSDKSFALQVMRTDERRPALRC